MDDQALVEGSVVFKDEDDPAEESPVSYQSRTWCLGSCRVTACPKIVAKKTWIKDGAQESSFLPDDGFCPGSKQDFLLVPQERTTARRPKLSFQHWALKSCSCCS